MKNRTDRLFEAIENPERFSDEELRELFENEETRELYGLLSKTSDALSRTSEPDIDAEWQTFAQEHPVISKPRRGLRRYFRISPTRNAAAVVIWATASLAIVAAAIGIGHTFARRNNPAGITEKAEPARVKSLNPAGLKESTEGDGPETATLRTIVFKNETFEAIIHQIAEYYGASVKYKTDNAKGLRLYFQWDRSLPLSEIVTQLNNFEQIKIKLRDNTLTIE